LTLPTPTAPVRCGQLRLDVSQQQGSYESVPVLSVDLRFETGASASRRAVESPEPSNYLRFEIYSKDESGSLN
jgi:hypothetical protein